MVFDKKEYMKQYLKTPQGIKTNRIGGWKTLGLKGDYEAIYQRYMNTTNCDLCNVELKQGQKGGNRKCMEHDHNTGQFRNIVCHACNLKKTDKKKRSDNTSRYNHIQYCKRKNLWVYDRKFNGKRIRICRKNKIEILCIKFAGILLYKY